MTREDKQLLLKDLCARLPYEVKILQGGVIIETLQSICKVGDNDYTVNPITNDMYNGFYIEQVKPYLRPMSSMTKGEEKEYSELWDLQDRFPTDADIRFKIDVFDWLNAHHFDYRGLIEKGLALEAPEGMYKTEKK